MQTGRCQHVCCFSVSPGTPGGQDLEDRSAGFLQDGQSPNCAAASHNPGNVHGTRHAAERKQKKCINGHHSSEPCLYYEYASPEPSLTGASLDTGTYRLCSATKSHGGIACRFTQTNGGATTSGHECITHREHTQTRSANRWLDTAIHACSYEWRNPIAC